MAKNEGSEQQFVELEQEDLPDIVNFDETPTVVGKLLSFKTITVDRKKVEAAIMSHDGRKFGVWISAGLTEVKEMREGTVLKLTSLGLEKVKRGNGHWRRFSISYDPSTGGLKPKQND